MATSKEFKDYVLECLQNASSLDFSFKKMFGNYCIYINYSGEKKPVFLLCDEVLFIKQHEFLKGLLSEKGKPFPKAKEWFIVDFENSLLLEKIFNALKSFL